MIRWWRAALVAAALGPRAAACQDGTDAVDTASLRGLPVTAERPVGDGNDLAFFITGDGGYTSADRAFARALAARGVAVLVLDARAYLRHHRSPERVAADAGRILRTGVARWHRDHIVLVGYSRGADIMPFVANRLPADLQPHVALVALFSVAPRASFEFHWRDLLFDTRRATDLPVLPELEKLRGTPILCAYGADEREPMCPTLDQSLAHVVVREGRHRLDERTARLLADRVLAELR
jgi:type IV secretory pathway VirJ component